MIKQMISFTDPQRAWLLGEARRLGISAAELVRRAVDAYRLRGNIRRALTGERRKTEGR